MDKETYKNAVLKAKVPILVLDNKWHRLFAVHGKPSEIESLEKELRELIARQGELNTTLKELKKLKAKLMNTIVENMGDNKKKSNINLSKEKRLIEETNSKISDAEEELFDIPRTISDKNKELMILTMINCYNYLRINEKEEKEIDEWINEFRVKLKKNIIRKQNRKINNKEMYAYMHDIFGKDVVELFDVRYESILEDSENKERKEKEEDKEIKKESKREGNKDEENPNV